MSTTLQEISTFLQQGRAKNVKELVQKALDEGLSAKTILDDGLLAGMGIIGGKFKNNEVYVPDVLVAARAMNAGAEILKPHIVAAGIEPRGTVILGTVRGDLHDIGKNLVRMMMEGKGLKVVDIGVDVQPDAFIDAAIEHKAQIIACSALLTTTMVEIEHVMDAMNKRGVRDQYKIMIGGAPVTQAFCERVGADCYTTDAASAADAALELATA